MTKRKVTLDDLEKFPQLGTKGVKEGDEHEFAEDGTPVLDESTQTPGPGDKRLVTAEEIAKYPQLTDLGVKEGDQWNNDWTF